jgi:IS5 family transposase
MHQTKKGNKWHFGMKAHTGVDAGTGYIHSVAATAANKHDITEAHKLIRDDDEAIYGDAGYTGLEKREEIKSARGSRELNTGLTNVPARRAKCREALRKRLNGSWRGESLW